MKYYLAYKDAGGRDMYPGLPWITPKDGMYILNEARKLQNKMRHERYTYTHVTLFSCEDEEMPEKVDWDFVDAHRVPDM